MAMVACKECSAELSTSAKACPKCGAVRPKPKLWLWVPLGLVGAFFAFGMVAGNSPEARAKSEARAKIKYCWSEQERKSLDSSSQRFVARVCEDLESDYRNRYGHTP